MRYRSVVCRLVCIRQTIAATVAEPQFVGAAKPEIARRR